MNCERCDHFKNNTCSLGLKSSHPYGTDCYSGQWTCDRCGEIVPINILRCTRCQYCAEC